MNRSNDYQVDDYSDISHRYKSIKQSLQSTAKDCSRDPATISLVAVSKTRTAEEIREIAVLGHRHFAENYVAEAVPKIGTLLAYDLVWHFIGTVQSNKTKQIAQNFDWVQSIDRESVARRLNSARERYKPSKKLNICIQVNVDDEPQKSGVRIDDLRSQFCKIAQLPFLRVRGLMTIPKTREDPEQMRESFCTLKQLYDELATIAQEPLDTLSMGMTNDFKIAISEGSSMVRLGTAIFGPRP